MATQYEIGDEQYEASSRSTRVKITMVWPYGEPTPPILHSRQILYLYSKKYEIVGAE